MALSPASGSPINTQPTRALPAGSCCFTSSTQANCGDQRHEGTPQKIPIGSDPVHENLLAQLALGAWRGDGYHRSVGGNYTLGKPELLDDSVQHGRLPLWLAQPSETRRACLSRRIRDLFVQLSTRRQCLRMSAVSFFARTILPAVDGQWGSGSGGDAASNSGDTGLSLRPHAAQQR